MTGTKLLTTGDLAELTGLDRSTVHRKIDELGIDPEMVAGRTRLFTPDVADRLAAYRGPRS